MAGTGVGIGQVSLVALAIALIHCSRDHSVVVSALGFSVIGFAVTDALISRCGPSFIKIGLFGKDMSKIGKPVLPEAIGAVSAMVYIMIMFFYIPFIFYRYMVLDTVGGGDRNTSVEMNGWSKSSFPHNKLSEYLSSVLCLESTIVLGIFDDLFDLRWRHKFPLPAIAAIPLLLVYYVDFGVTYVLVPNFAKDLFQGKTLVDLGVGYYGYMAAMAIFCPNSINILAGVNGLEVGQSIVLASLSLINDLLYLTMGNESSRDSHLFSAVLIIPFLGVSSALYKWNRWPAKVFVGDTYCYFAGMVFAVVGILGHFSKTMLMLFIPQILNFIYSCPQLFNIVTCPRHRLPKFNEKDGLLYTSRVNLKENPPKRVFVPVLRILHFCKLIDLETDQDGTLVSCSNMTLINLVLVWFGPMREDKLCQLILKLQFAIGLLSLFGRHAVGAILFGHDNLWTIS
ncbi:UDP-N-acetylglucosamine--dolichyl-phosphate N-acetylglucosaminephosphotransferase KNAG_0M00580 [Huiozyma naganishii CBS 8797]|uniref:UDP-N-acetylglucosamine--dolichyl-phosphate N-acetylglucosaminephosphotransferase n=1 Tax=Huiozyma naganishii (strain ATCC MYA-139 / BCRC 22969 / CBS 8797 / KCTC 17520 / NBRC 10181 / NCYC 3082 / Yp74L-3) TaxID=1071383 RepID=J7SBB2_HUIN7|nr:hypothetical protein KNAG_0M00580 [Kazachstania naganishii CBS 8797]CCK72911.1 hypothetical protein KNAG_0M00580 [Kazachstania naganishii CBS 8797]